MKNRLLKFYFLYRIAFDDLDLILSLILCRLKEAFSDDAFTKKKSVYQYMQEYAEIQMFDNGFHVHWSHIQETH